MNVIRPYHYLRYVFRNCVTVFYLYYEKVAEHLPSKTVPELGTRKGKKRPRSTRAAAADASSAIHAEITGKHARKQNKVLITDVLAVVPAPISATSSASIVNASIVNKKVCLYVSDLLLPLTIIQEPKNPIYLFFRETNENPNIRRNHKISAKDKHYQCRHVVPGETEGRYVTIGEASKGSTNGTILLIDACLVPLNISKDLSLISVDILHNFSRSMRGCGYLRAIELHHHQLKSGSPKVRLPCWSRMHTGQMQALSLLICFAKFKRYGSSYRVCT
jgi:hypothetical protein